MKLIVNADDFGYSKGVNLGILECFKNGVLTSTSLMVNMPGFQHAIDLMRTNKELKVGIHLVMTVGKPICKDLKTIVNAEGNFERSEERVINGDIEEIKKEYRAQLDTFLATGFKPTHIDFHVRGLDCQFAAAMELAKEYGLPMRCMYKEWKDTLEKEKIKNSPNFIWDFHEDYISPENFISILEKYKNLPIIEIMTHPAYVDATVLECSSYNVKRAYELETLTNDKVKEYIRKSDIECIDYTDL